MRSTHPARRRRWRPGRALRAGTPPSTRWPTAARARSTCCWRPGAGERIAVAAVDALGRPRAAEIGLLPDGTAVVETASAIGLGQLAAAERDPLRASSAGAAPLVRAALDAGARRIVLCLGGSASVDGGLGLLAGARRAASATATGTRSPAPAPTSTASRCWSARASTSAWPPSS